MQQTKVFNTKRGMEVVFKSSNVRRMRSGDEDVININGYNGNVSS